MSDLTPREIVSELDRFIIGQKGAKKAVAIALRNRWRRRQLPIELREEIYPKNILMIGPTGVGKTEISRRLAKLAHAPFLKVEATKFTEVGYVGRDVEQIIRDLMESAIIMIRDKRRLDVEARAHTAAEERVLDAICGEDARETTREIFRKKLCDGLLDDREIEITLSDNSNPMQLFDLPNQPNINAGMLDLGDLIGKTFGGGRTQTRKTTVAKSYDLLIADEADKLLDQESITTEAIQSVEENGIIFLDEIDKVATRQDTRGGEVSREGVQRDLLPLIEGTTVNTKYGPVKSDHILFIASGAFHIAKPSDLLPELQGRLPIRVELKTLDIEDFIQILTNTDNALTKQYHALLKTENIDVEFTDDGIESIAQIAAQVNENIENIGARRLYTIMEHVFEELNFHAADMSNQKIIINKKYVESALSDLVASNDLSRYML